MLFVLLLGLVGNTNVNGQPQSYVFRNITTADGLASNVVTGIIQDDKGFIWIGTLNGLQKFDGYSFTTFHHDPYDPQSISSDNAGFLLKDRENSIWISTFFSGFNRFNPSTGKNIRISDPDDSSFRDLDNSISSCLDTQGNTWLLSSNAVTKYDCRRHKLVFYDHLFPKDIAMNWTKSIVYDPQSGNLWMNSVLYGIAMLDPKQAILFSRNYNPEKLPIFDLVKAAGTLFMDKEHNLWINTYAGRLYRYNIDTHAVKEYFLNDPNQTSANANKILIDCMMQDSHGTVWMGARKRGLLAYSPQSDSFRVIPQNAGAPGALNYNEYVFSLFEDRDGNLWVGSDKGIFIFNPYLQPFNSVKLPPDKNGTQNITAVSALTEMNNGDIWVATYGQGIQVFNDRFQFKTAYSYSSIGTKKIGEPGNHVWCFLNQANGKVLIGCQHGWITTYDPTKEGLINEQPAALNGTIINMISDSAENIWLALYSGLARWDNNKKEFIKCPEILSYHKNHTRQVFDLLLDNQQNLWLATQTNGLQQFNTQSLSFSKIYVPEKENPNGISSSSVQCMAKVNDSIIALGTSSGGINLFNRVSGQFSYITAKEGLPSNDVTALYFQSPSSLWAATNRGLCRVDIKTKLIYHYGLEDGIISDDFNDCTRFYKTKNGHLLIGFNGGFVSFNPDSIGIMDAPKDVAITGFRIYDQPLQVDSLLRKSDTISLSADQNFFTIDYAALSFLQPERFNYYYRLNGVDRNWIIAGKQRSASYTNLSPGSYLFSVKCENRDGIASTHITTLFFVIHPPFWKTWWFICLVVVAIAILLYSLYRYRINQLLKLQAIRNEISKDLHDDLGSTLGSISILSEVAKNNIRSSSEDQTYSLLTKISNNAREMVDKMSDIVWAINPKNETLERIIQRLTDFGLATCASKEIRLEIISDDSMLKRVLPMESVKNIYLIVKEAMNNAIKHAHCSSLVISFKSTSLGLHISIMDDGIGFDPGIVKNGNGLINMESRVKEMKGHITISSKMKNTTINLWIPIT